MQFPLNHLKLIHEKIKILIFCWKDCHLSEAGIRCVHYKTSLNMKLKNNNIRQLLSHCVIDENKLILELYYFI